MAAAAHQEHADGAVTAHVVHQPGARFALDQRRERDVQPRVRRVRSDGVHPRAIGVTRPGRRFAVALDEAVQPAWQPLERHGDTAEGDTAEGDAAEGHASTSPCRRWARSSVAGPCRESPAGFDTSLTGLTARPRYER